ncbi:putative RNA-directed DNA polymerase [Helianthus annuus]|nr:putative RNA-directed DNA polymerase [Helianthus annuus]
MIETQFRKRIKRIRCDNGGEFTSNRMKTFYSQEGILLETTCPYTPQQNGVVERKHRHLLETARALMFQGSLPKKFWGECIETAVYIINRLPSKVIHHKTPHEIIMGNIPDYEEMRTMGCLVYYHSTVTGGDKFEPRGKPGVFIGYPVGIKGYKIFDIEDVKFVVSRDVRFFEKIFPYMKLKEESIDKSAFEIPTWFEDTDEERNNQLHSHEGGPPQPSTESSSPASDNGNSHDTSRPSSPLMQPIFEQEQSSPPMEDQSVVEPIVNDAEQPARSKRDKSQPARFRDFDVELPPSIDHTRPDSDHSSSTVYPFANYVSYDKFSDTHKAYLAAITKNSEPKIFYQATQDIEWRKAMQKEIEALEENDTWSLEDLPKGKHAIDSKWVYKIKYKPNGDIERYKARLVAKGFTQIEGVDYHDTFAPVAKLVTVRCLLTVAVKRNWLLHQLDVNNAFLHGDLREEVYMKIPQGFSKRNETRVCKLKKSLYGLKQASRTWYQKFTNALIEFGYKQSRADHSLFTVQEGELFVAILIYVDDVIITGNHLSKIDSTKKHLSTVFSIKDLGPLKYFLGIEVAKTSDGLVLSQRKYTIDILQDCGLLSSRPSSFPMEQNAKIDDFPASPRTDATQYQRIIGRLLYLQVTRPDIAYSVNILSQFVSDPRKEHMEAVTRILRYLKATPGQGIYIPKHDGFQLVAYCDADWLGCLTTRRSRTGYILILGGSPVSWKTKKQSVVSRSSAEAEYRAMAATVSEVLWLRWLLQDFNVHIAGPTPMFCDNQVARHIANNPVFHERTKHVEMDCYFVRERVISQEIQPVHVDSKLQLADLLTKPLGAQQLQFLLNKLGIRDLHAPA